ncbi:YmfL family putative regulatory protein [Massilia timonae]|uniref:YmfL family putative regulatory protein n=1 Tax=Massilia timonae TaxID=47229 RepID=UPI0028D6EE97|nr:YmfL family putative regulatory protein [Massilia timonae]
MDLLSCYQEMIKVHGWNGTAATLGMTKSQLEARVYEVKGSGMRVDTALLIQAYSGTSHFAQAVAAATGGVFVQLPEGEGVTGEELHGKFHELYVELGRLSATYTAAIADGEIDRRERDDLEDIGQQMHKTTQELMALMFQIYCRPVVAGVPSNRSNDS